MFMSSLGTLKDGYMKVYSSITYNMKKFFFFFFFVDKLTHSLLFLDYLLEVTCNLLNKFLF